MALNNLEDRLECAIAHINTSVDIDPWAQKLAVESMRMRIALMKGGQPEKLTDKEQRIFLSAMGREEEVCKEVDDAWRDCREPYEDSLVYVCKEIRRKVKGALWT